MNLHKEYSKPVSVNIIYSDRYNFTFTTCIHVRCHGYCSVFREGWMNWSVMGQ